MGRGNAILFLLVINRNQPGEPCTNSKQLKSPLLDGFEGVGNGYETQSLNVSYDAKEYACFTYLAQASHIDESLRPFHWYKEVVSVGARYLGFPQWYLALIDGHGSMQDWDQGRVDEHRELLVRMEGK